MLSLQTMTSWEINVFFFFLVGWGSFLLEFVQEENWWKYKQRVTWSQQWKARLYKITKFVFCKMNLVKQSHLRFPSPTLKQDSRFVVKKNSFSAWANTEMATAYEMPCRQVILQGGLIHQGCTRGSGPFRQCYWYCSGCNTPPHPQFTGLLTSSPSSPFLYNFSSPAPQLSTRM